MQDGFVKVDHDYVVNVARVAKEAGCKHFNLVTSTGANANSPMLYPQTKGRAEEDTKAIGFEKLTIYRPAVLMCKRVDRRLVDTMTRTVLTPVAALFPTAVTIPTAKVAKAMVNSAILQADAQLTLENAAVHAMAQAIA
jgi:oxidoreductase